MSNCIAFPRIPNVLAHYIGYDFIPPVKRAAQCAPINAKDREKTKWCIIRSTFLNLHFIKWLPGASEYVI